MYGATKMYSIKAIELHFWISTIGIVLYIAAMWIAGVMQGLMWRSVNPDGTLTYSFVESVKATYPFYVVRLLGGLLYLSGMLVMTWNVIMTIRQGRPVGVSIPAPASRLNGKKVLKTRATANRKQERQTKDPGSHEVYAQGYRNQQSADDRADRSGGGRGRSRRDCPAVLSAQHDARRRPASSLIRRCNWPGAISIFARVVTTAIRK